MHAIVHELTIAAEPDAVYEAITTPAGLAGWWTTDVNAAQAVDRESVFGFAGHSVVLTMRVDLLEPPELVHWECVGGPDEWIGTKLAFRIEPIDADDDGRSDGVTRVRFWHGDWEYDDGLLPTSSFEWAMYLDSLRRYLETGTGSPDTA
jgi:uncharacterized protein YndB with AHSA1/START domain